MRRFVKEKAINFREMLRPFCNTPDTKEFLSKYNEDQVEDLVLEYLAPLYQTNMLSVAKDAIVSQLSISDPAIIAKVERYLLCFCECIIG